MVRPAKGGAPGKRIWLSTCVELDHSTVRIPFIAIVARLLGLSVIKTTAYLLYITGHCTSHNSGVRPTTLLPQVLDGTTRTQSETVIGMKIHVIVLREVDN